MSDSISGDRKKLTINTENRFMVGVGVVGDRQVIRVLRHPQEMTKSEALALAAWLVVLVDDRDEFEEYLNAVRGT